MNHKKAVLITSGVALLWSLAGWNIKMIQWSPFAIAGGRSVIAAILLLPVMIKKGGIKVTPAAIGGAVCYMAFNYCFIYSTKYATSAFAIMMQYTAPVYVAILSWLVLKEHVTKMDVMSIIAVLVGMLFFFIDSADGGSIFGKIVAVMNGITFAGVSFFLRIQKNENPVVSMFLGNVLSGIVGLFFMIHSTIPDGTSLAFLGLAGFLCAFTYMMYALASTGLSTLETVLLPVIDPVMNPVWVFLFCGERPGALSIAGAMVILAAILIRGISGVPRKAFHKEK